jgi:predicted MPP superfamily phosphohydrolase
MKFFWHNLIVKVYNKLTISLFIAFLCYSCATSGPQYGEKAIKPIAGSDTLSQQKPEHTLFLVGDAGYANEPHSQQLLAIIKDKLKASGKNTSLFYLGDNIYPLGMPPKEMKEERKEAEASLISQTALSESFEGKVYFIPGNHDWYHGLKGLEEEAAFVKDQLKDKKAFLPSKGCGIEDIEISRNITLIAIDSQWFIEDWDNYPTINDDCTLKTRDGLFTELESLLNKNQDKTVILAIHHPLISNGTHGGQFSARKQLFPLKYNVPIPVIGSIINLMRKSSGYSTQDLQSRVYSTLANRIKTLLHDKDNVIVVSGHEHNLQYVNKDNIHQIISGAGSKMEAAKAVNPDDFSYGGTGYATLGIYKDGSAKVSYFCMKDGKEEMLFEKTLLEKHDAELKKYSTAFPATFSASVYTAQMTQKSAAHNFLFGRHYRPYYSMPIVAKTVLLDTIYGGLTPDRAGGGHQSKSLRLKDKDGKEYVMRGLRKSATRFLQATAFKGHYIGDSFEDTYAEDFLMDFYTTAHPYTPFIVDLLAEKAGIYHTNPKLFYIPKQNALGKFNDSYGDELYMVEERPTDEFKDLESFGRPDAIEGTDDVLVNLQKDKKYTIDERAYIRARLFDMLIGDWDRHGDQWRWARFNEKDKVVYRPIPRDRDQAFPKYDGVLVSLLMNIPPLRHMQDYKDDISNVKWLNREPFAQDLAFITASGEEVWLEEAKKLQENLTDEVIDKAFLSLPGEMQDETIETIKATLKKRKVHLNKYALDYRAALLKTVLITGTDKKEKFIITRLPGGDTEVKMFTAKKDGSEVLAFNKMYNIEQTKEIWIYGLDDDDAFEVTGKPEDPILIRLLGGQNHDSYTIENGKKINVYDFRSKENTYNTDRKTRLLLTDDYETNGYDYKKPEYNIWAGYPLLGYNPDDGVKAGVLANYTINNFNRRPYSQKHSLRANYFFATDGFELGYHGIFMNVASKWNFAVDAWYTSPNFSINYFGFGNETGNHDDKLGMDYNRVKLQVFRIAPSFFTQSRNGSTIEFQAPFETIEVDGTTGRFVNQPGAIASYLFEHRQYGALTARYSFSNYDNVSLPALGMAFNLLAGWKNSLDQIEQNFPFLESSLSFVHRLTPDDALVFATTIKGKALLNNDFEFYQAATLGGDMDLRGYRRERFTGKQSFYQSSDVRLTLGRWKSSLLPMRFGMFAGFDYGRVWVKNDDSEKWHNSAGGGLWLNGADAVTAKLSYFNGADGGRIAFGLVFGL